MNPNVIEIKDLDDQKCLVGFLTLHPSQVKGKFIFENEADKLLFDSYKQRVYSFFNQKQNDSYCKEQSIQTSIIMIDQSIQSDIQQNQNIAVQSNLSNFETKTDLGQNEPDFEFQQEDQSMSESQIQGSNIDPSESQFMPIDQSYKQKRANKSGLQQSNVSTQEYADQQSLKDNLSILELSRDLQISPQRERQFENENELNSQINSDILYQGKIQLFDLQSSNEIDRTILDDFIESMNPKQLDIPTEICLQGLQNNQTINLKDYFIMEIIQEFYQNEWNKLIQSLGLQKRTMRKYKLTGKENFQQVIMEIASFLKQISYVQIYFCYQTNQTLINSSSMNSFLQQQGVFVFHGQDQFYLVSNKNSEEQLKVLSQQINDNYRGIILYFDTLKSYKPTSYDNQKMLGKLRKDYYHQYLKEQMKNYSFNQFSNEQYFLCEMNFSKITFNKELTEKIIKKHIEFHYQNLLLLQFKYQQQQHQDQIFKNLVQKQTELKKKLILHSQNNEYYALGLSSDLAEIIFAVENQLTSQNIKFVFISFEIKILKANYKSDIIDQKSIDIQGATGLLKQQGLIVDENDQEIICKMKSTTKCSSKNFLILLRFWCDLHRNNQNQSDMISLQKQFRQNIEGKELNKTIEFLENTQLIGTIDDEINLNIIPQKNQKFTKKEYIYLKSPYLDIVIYNNIADEFYDAFANFTCQFEKTSEGIYLLQAYDPLIIQKIKNYFDSFYIEEIQLNQENLKAFELSFYLKKLFKKQQFYYIVTNGKLALVYKTPKNLAEIKQTIQNYQAKILHMANLGCDPQNVKPDYMGLISARIGFMKCFLSPQLKQFYPSMIEIEHLQETEISAFIIIHFSFNMNLHQVSIEQLEYFYSIIVSSLEAQTYVEIKINNSEGLELFQQISAKKKQHQVYVSQRVISQVNMDLQLTLLASREALQEINQSCDVTKFKDETLKNMELSFYVEQLCPFKNQVQFQEDRKKLKKELEKKGFIVNESQIKWKVQTLNPQQIFSIFTILAEKTKSCSTIQELQNNNKQFGQEKPCLPLIDASSIFQIQNKSQDQSIQTLVGQMQSQIIHQQDSGNDLSQEILKSFVQKEDNAKKQREQQDLQIQVKQALPQKPIIIEIQKEQNSEIQMEDSNFESSKDSKDSSQHNLASEFLKKGLIVQFATERRITHVLLNDSVVRYLMKREPNIQLECFYPKVNDEYINYFERKTNNKTQDVYMVVKPDKEIYDQFSRKIILLKSMEKAVDKFLGHKSSILVQVKASSMAKYWLPDKQKPEQICLKEENLILPHLCYIRKEMF